MSFQINFYLLRPIASDGDKITRENVAMEVTTPLQILQDDSSAPSSVGIFLRAGQRRLWVLSVTQIPYRPKGGVVPTLSCSLPLSASCRTQSWTGEMTQRTGLKPAISCLSLHCHTEKVQEVKGKCLIFECSVGHVTGVRLLAWAAHFCDIS